MKKLLTLLEVGLTRRIIINKLCSILLAFLIVSVQPCQAAEVNPYLSLYGKPKYNNNFKNFEYVNPKAPKGGKVVMPTYGSFDNFNPFIFKGIANGQVAGMFTDTLGVTPIDDVSTAYPLIAKLFEMPKDGSYVGFILDERAKFHDGSPILADDVIFSFESLINDGSPLYRIYYADVEKVEKVSKRKVRFHFKKESQNKELPLILAQLPVFSKTYWQGKDFSKPILEPQLGNGPYKVDKFSPSKYIVLKKVENYWAKDLPSIKGFFNFDEVRFDYYQDTTVTLQALFAGNIDVREEYIAKIWVTGYDNALVKSGKVIKENIAHNNTAILQNFAFNLRKDKFKDKRVREAIGLAFNFEWANEKLFYGQYSRLDSYFSNSEMAATGRPQGKELQILRKYKNDLREEVFGDLPQIPTHEDYKKTRENLRNAVKLLNEAGYDFVDGKMVNTKTNEPLEFEVLSSSSNGSTFTRVMLPFIENLKKIGIKASFRSIESNIFKNRIDDFDYDVVIISFPMSSMPGNEQKEMWGSQSADVKGSFNLIGVKNPVVDKLIDGLVSAQEKEDYIAHAKALDRVLRHESLMIPQWYSSYNRIAYRDRLERPKTKVRTGWLPMTWWVKEEK